MSDIASAPPASAAAETEAKPVENATPAAAGVVAMDKDKPESKTEAPKADADPETTTHVNGESTHNVEESLEKPEDPSQLEEDTEMQDASILTANASSTPAKPSNGTPASSKRAAPGGSSKKKGGVPEHKTKKLQRKKSRPLTNLDAQPGQTYFARMKGHPPWPSIICDEAMLPVSLLSSRPVTAKAADGSFRKEEYADGGKRAHERTFPIMFLHTNEFAWIPNTELTPLDPEDDAIKNPVEKGKSKTLLAAYAKAAEANNLQHFKTMLAEHQKALADDLQEREERAAEKEKAKKAKKADKSRKSLDATANEDEMEIDEEDGTAKPKSKKRKKADESDADEKPAKTPKTATKLKLSEPKTPGESAKKKTPKSKSSAKKESSEDDSGKAEEKVVSPEEALVIKERKVLYYRHKLQRSMLSRDAVPKEDEMETMSEYMTELESYQDLEASIIRKTKIHKVLKNILKIATIPLEEKFKFKDRSRDLLAKWTEILAKDPAGGSGEGADEKADDNGKADEAPTAAETSNSVSAAPLTTTESAPVVANGATSADDKKDHGPTAKTTNDSNKIGTTVEGEKEADKPAEEAKAAAKEATTEEKQTDGPAIETAPGAEYKPPVDTAAAQETAA